MGYLATFMLKRKWANEENGLECFMKEAAQLYKIKTEDEVPAPDDCTGEEIYNADPLEPCLFTGDGTLPVIHPELVQRYKTNMMSSSFSKR